MSSQTINSLQHLCDAGWPKISSLLLLFLFFFLPPFQEGIAQQKMVPNQSEQTNREAGSATVVIYARSSRGTQLLHPAAVRLIARGGNYDQSAFTQKKGEAIFQGVPLGNYTAEVTSTDSIPTRENILVQSAGGWVTVVINLTPLLGSATAPMAPMTSPIPELSFDLQHELDKALKAMQDKDMTEAGRILQKAAKQVPKNPEPYYLMGVLALQMNDLAQAKGHLEKAVSLSPNHARALASWGEVLMREENYGEASRVLGRALDHEPHTWQTHAMLASALYREDQLEAARVHAERAVELSKSSSPEAYLLVVQVLVGLGEREKARSYLEVFLKQWPQHPRATDARVLLEGILSAGNVPGPNMAPPIIRGENPESSNRAWAPPDVDSRVPAVTSDIPCVLPSVLEAAGSRARLLVETLQKISARETIEQAVLDKNGVPKILETGQFNYLVIIRQNPGSVLSVNEYRDGPFSPKSFSSGMSANGLPAMALIFHPHFAPDYEMTCEGLSEWRGQSAWVVHFRHRPDRHNYFFLYVTPQGEFEIKLKGRAWIATKTGDVLEMETDLVEAVPDALLTRSHLNVEYGPVSFASTEDFLWLPVRAELFSEVKNRRSRIRHTFRDFHIFSVTTDQKITVPEPKNPLK